MLLPGEESSKAFHNRVAKDNEGKPLEKDVTAEGVITDEGQKDQNITGLPNVLKPNDTVGLAPEKGLVPGAMKPFHAGHNYICLLYTSPSPRDRG